MDPLSIFGAVAGGISVTSEIVKALDKAISKASSVKEAPDLAVSTLRDVSMMRLTMLSFQQLLDSQRLDDQRSIYFSLDDAQNVFLGCVTSLDQLENLLRPLSDPRLQSLDISDRLGWAMKDKRINQLAQRVRDAQASLSLMLIIMQHESLIEAREAIADLSEICKRIAPNVAHLKRRSIQSIPSIQSGRESVQSDDASTIRPAPTKRPESTVIQTISPQNGVPTSRFAFEEALEASRPYRRAPSGVDEVFSYRSSALNMHALSLLSELSRRSLGNMSTMSFVALPIFCNDLSNPQHYKFGDGDDTAEQSAPTVDLDMFPSAPPTRPLPPTPYLTPPSTPQSPSPPTPQSPSSSTPQGPSSYKKGSMWGMLKVIRKPFESETTGSSRSPGLLYPPPSPSLETPLSIRNNIPSMEQLSQLQLKNSEWHLCHGAGGAPCRGAIGMSLCQEFPPEQVYASQIDLAMVNGFLDQFYCQGCESTLAAIVSARRPGWSSFELWCGSRACLSTKPDLWPCASYPRSLKGCNPMNDFLGYRNLSRSEVQCARCFFLCPACEMKRGEGDEGSLLRAEDAETPGQLLFRRQDRLLAAQRRGAPNLKHSISQLDRHIQSLQDQRDAPKAFLDGLKERQEILKLRRGIIFTIPDWEEIPADRTDLRPAVYYNSFREFEASQDRLDEISERMRSLDSCPPRYMDEDTLEGSWTQDVEHSTSSSRSFLPGELFYQGLDEVIEESGGI